MQGDWNRSARDMSVAPLGSQPGEANQSAFHRARCGLNKENEMLTEEQLETIDWYQEDACYGYLWASVYRDTLGKEWLAARVQRAAAVSAKCARVMLGIE